MGFESAIRDFLAKDIVDNEIYDVVIARNVEVPPSVCVGLSAFVVSATVAVFVNPLYTLALVLETILVPTTVLTIFFRSWCTVRRIVTTATGRCVRSSG